jgi:hypothetical protein
MNQTHSYPHSVIELLTGSEPSVSPLFHLEVSSSTRYISLVELDAPLLYDASVEMFDRVRKLLITCSSVLRVTVGAYRFADNPENNFSQELLHTVRSEVNNVAAMLDLDPNSQLEYSDRAQLIFDSLKASFYSPEGDSPVDYEFEDGQLMVPRVVKQKNMNLTFFHATVNDAVPAGL